MSDRDGAIAAFLDEMQWARAQRVPLAGDASARRYFRLTDGGRRAVLMDAPPEGDQNTTAFISLALHLRTHGVSAPEIYGTDAQRGFILMEDLGDALFARKMETETPLPLYSAAIDLLEHMRTVPPIEALTVFDPATMAQMINPCFEWYTRGLGRDLDDGVVASILVQLETEFVTIQSLPPALTLRDFHAENLLWLPSRKGIARVGVLDFQDAVLAHPAYDLVSILQDARRDVGDDVEAAMIARYISVSGVEPDAFRVAYALLGLQRNMRILGVFARLAISLGKPRYVRLIPRVYAHVQRNLQHPALSGLAPKIAAALPEPTDERLARLIANAA